MILPRWLRSSFPPIIVFIVAALALELWLRSANVPQYLVPRPSAVLVTMFEARWSLLGSLGKTAVAAMLGFAASALAGVLLAILLSASGLIRQALYPYTIFFQTVPVVAIAPMLVIWFEAGLASVAICAFIVSVFPVIANTLSGILSTDPQLRDLFRLYGASWPATLWKLKLPSALPNIFTGLRIAAGLAVIGTIVGEFAAAQLQENPGLGIVILQSARQGQTAGVFAAIIASSLLGLAMLCAVNLAAHLTLRQWHASEQIER